MIGSLLKGGIKSLILGAIVAAGSKAVSGWAARRDAKVVPTERRLEKPSGYQAAGIEKPHTLTASRKSDGE